MRNLINILILFSFILSCNSYSKDDYPKLGIIKTGTYHHIESCYFIETDDFNVFPENIRDSIENFYQKRIGLEYFKKLKFDFGYINSDKPIQPSKESEIDSLLFDYWEKPKICDSTYLYPVYTTAFNIEYPEIGIEKLAVNLVMDSNGNIIKDFQYPNFGNAADEKKIIPIDSVNSILVKRRIPSKKLYIDIRYNEKANSLYWFPNTLVRPGSIAGPSCFPEVEYHFFMDMFTGEIIEID